MALVFRKILASEFTVQLLLPFDRYQESMRMWQRGPNEWALTPQKCIKNWTEEDKAFLASYFQKKCMRKAVLHMVPSAKRNLLHSACLKRAHWASSMHILTCWGFS